ncbi:hypothetical protein AB0J83_16380 [Actinoplanes sp. NPDC049596]|uniref:hypothetical protein n=1 Tax=unclassified Actinoplanes TaxID=2626549 RepID=UPI00343E7C28
MPADVLFDVASHYPEAGVVRTAMTARDWSKVRTTVDAAPPAGRSMLLGVAADVPGAEETLQEVLAADPGDSAAAATLGQRWTAIGWKIRSAARAEYVTAEQFAAFHERLRRAEAVLIEGVARNPGDPALWAARLTSGRGLEVGLAEIRRRYDKAIALDPGHLPAQWAFLQSLCPKWSGSWELLHPWARETALAAPPGSTQGALVVDAHLEHWLDLPGGEGDRYLTSAPVRDEIYEAARHSVLHPGFGRDYGWVHAASSFALAFSMLGDEEAAGAMFKQLGDLADDYPWSYLGDPAAQIRTRRARALGGAR